MARHDDDTLLLRCDCHSMHFLQVWRDDDTLEPFFEATVIIQPHGLWQRVKYAFNALCRPASTAWESQYVVFSGEQARELAAFVSEKLN